jgi:heat shock protein beta
MLKVMSRKLVRKALEMIRKMADVDAVEEEDEDDDESEGKKDGEEKITKEEDEKESTEEIEKKKKEKRDRFNEFWKEFGKNIKLGIIEDSANRQKLAKLSRWYSSKNSTELTSFD